MAQTVEQLAETVGASVERLLSQMKEFEFQQDLQQNQLYQF